MKNQFLLKSFVQKKSVFERNFIKLNTLFFKSKNSSFILGKRNNIYFYKIDRCFLLLNDILYFYLNFLKKNPKSFLFSDRKLFFLFSKEASLRSFQTIFFGKYGGGMFANNIEKTKIHKKLFNKIDIFIFLFIQDSVFSFKELHLLKKPLVAFLEEQANIQSYLFYRILFKDNPFFFNYFILRLLSDFLIKIRLYNYIESN
jgi:hypothetical protein